MQYALYNMFPNLAARQQFADRRYGTGCHIDILDKHDNIEVLGSGEFDWEKGYSIEEELTNLYSKLFTLPISDQNGSLSCVGQGSAKYASVLNYIELGQWIPASARDIYSNIYIIYGGAYLRNGIRWLVNKGVVPEHHLPSYNQGVPPKETFMRKKARVSVVTENLRQVLRGREYRGVPANIDDFAKAIQLNHGMLIGFNGDNNGTWHSQYPTPPDARRWGHGVYAGWAGLIAGRKYIGFANSWGKFIGKNGWQFIGEDWFDSDNVFPGWVLSDQPNQIDNEVTLNKIYNVVISKKTSNPYHSKNWDKVLAEAGVSGITVGKYYDYAQAKKLREQYGI